MLSSAYDTDAMLPVSSPSGRVNLDTEQAPPGALRVPVLDAAVHLHRHSGPGAQKQAIVRDRYGEGLLAALER